MKIVFLVLSLVMMVVKASTLTKDEIEKKVDCYENETPDAYNEICSPKGDTIFSGDTKEILAKAMAAMKEGREKFDELMISYMFQTAKKGTCYFRKKLAKCGIVPRKDLSVVSEIARRAAKGCSNILPARTMGVAEPYCLSDDTEERTALMRGYLCVMNNPSTPTYSKQCFQAMIEHDDINFTNAMTSAIECDPKDKSSRKNQCMLFYGAIRDQCGLETAKRYYQLVTKKACKRDIQAPEKLFFDYDPNGTGSLFRVQNTAVLSLSVVVYMLC